MPTERGLNKHRGRKTKEQKWRETDERYREIGKRKNTKRKNTLQDAGQGTV